MRFLPFLLAVISGALLVVYFSNLTGFENVSYTVANCDELSEQYYMYENGILFAYVGVNCCSDEIKVKRSGNEYRIEEKDYDGILCRCMCTKNVTIFEVSEPFEISFIDKDGRKFSLNP